MVFLTVHLRTTTGQDFFFTTPIPSDTLSVEDAYLHAEAPKLDLQGELDRLQKTRPITEHEFNEIVKQLSKMKDLSGLRKDANK